MDSVEPAAIPAKSVVASIASYVSEKLYDTGVPVQTFPSLCVCQVRDTRRATHEIRFSLHAHCAALLQFVPRSLPVKHLERVKRIIASFAFLPGDKSGAARDQQKQQRQQEILPQVALYTGVTRYSIVYGLRHYITYLKIPIPFIYCAC